MLSVVVDSLTFIGPFSKIAVPAGNNNNTKKNNNSAASTSSSSTPPAKNNKAASSSPPKPNKETINPILPRILLVARSFLHSSLVPHYFMLDDTFTGFGSPVIRSDDPSTHGKLPLLAQQGVTPQVIINKAELQHANSLIRFLVKSSTLQFTRTLKLLAPPLKSKNIEDTIRRFVSFPYFCRTVSKLYLNGETVDDITFHLIKQMRSLHSLTFDSCTKLTRNSIPHLGSFTELDELVFCGGFRKNSLFHPNGESDDDGDDDEGTADSRIKVFDDFFTALANMKYLRILTLQTIDLQLHYSITNSSDKMKKCKNQIDEKFQGRLAHQNPRLEQISICFDFLSPAIGFIFLDGLPRLRVLNLDVVSGAGHYDPSPLNKLHQSVYKTFAFVSPTLEHLEVNASTNYFQYFVQDHDEIMKLEEEQAANGGDNTPAENDDFEQAIHFGQLLSLEVCLPTRTGHDEKFRGFQQVLESAPKLKHLRIEGDRATEIGLFREIFFKNSSSNSNASSTKNIESRLIFPSLESLDFSTSPHIDNYRTEAVKRLMTDICENHTQLQQNLKSFNISGLPMKIGFLENISSLSKLEALDISLTQMHIDSSVTDADVDLYYSPIKRMKQLRIFSALSVEVRPYLFEVLATLENLEIVNFASVSPHQIEILEAGKMFLSKNTSSQNFHRVKICK